MVSTDRKPSAENFGMKTTTVRSIVCTLVLVAAASGIAAGSELPTDTGRRPHTDGEPTDITVFLYVIDVSRIDGATQSFTADVFILLSWNDPRLVSTEHGTRRLPLDRVWSPMIQILNQQRVDLTFPEIVEVQPDGHVIYRQRYYGDFAAPMDLHDFPMDRHRIGFRLVVPGYAPEEVRLIPDGRDFQSAMSNDLSIVDWTIRDFSVLAEPFEVIPGRRAIAGYVADFEAHRHLGFYAGNAFLSVMIIVLMSWWIVFWVDPSHVAPRMSIAVTSMLTLIAYRFLLGQVLPPLSYLTRMDYFLLGSTLLVLVAIIQVALTTHQNVAEQTGRARSLNRLSRWVFPVAFLGLSASIFWVG